MKTAKRAAYSIGKMTLATGIVSSVCALWLFNTRFYIQLLYWEFHKFITSYDAKTENEIETTASVIAFVFLAISVTELVLGASLVKRKKTNKINLFLTFTIVLALFSVLSLFFNFLTGSFNFFWISFLSELLLLAVLVLCIITLPKLLRFKKDSQTYETMFSCGFQYDGKPVFVSGQKLNYGNTEKPQAVSQGFSYIEEESSGVVNAQKKCIRCGKENDSNAKFCEACGYSKFINN